MSYTPALYRLVIVDPDSVNTFTPGDTTVHADHLSVDSRRTTATRNYITDPPSDDGDRLDILTGTIDDAACVVSVSDVGEYVTAWLADSAARYQLSGREAYVEKSVDAGTTWTIVRHGFVTDIELPRAQSYLITIGAARKKERSMTVGRLLHALPAPDGGLYFYPFYQTAIIGGPIFGGMPGYQDPLALPLFRVEDRHVSASYGWISIKWAGGPLPPWFPGTSLNPGGRPPGARDTAELEFINTMAAGFFVDSTRLRDPNSAGEKLRGSFPNVHVYLYDAAAPQTLLHTRFAIGNYTDSGGTTITNQSGRNFISNDGRIHLPWDEDDDGTTPTVGTLFAVAVVPMVMSEAFPTYYLGHPLVVVATALANLGRTVDGASLVAAQSALGGELGVMGRLTDPQQKVMEWINQLGAMFGFALVLMDDSTDLQVVLTRDRYVGSAPDAITDTDLRAIGGPTFKLAASSRRTGVRATFTQFLLWNILMGVDWPYSNLVGFETPFEVTSDEADEDDQVIELSLDGRPMAISFLSTAVPPAPVGLELWIRAHARRILERCEHGTPEYQFLLTATSAANPPLSGLVTMSTSHLPNAQVGGASRGGPRPGRLIARTRPPDGDVLTLIDEGTGQQFDAGTLGIADLQPNITQPNSFVDLDLDGISSLAGPAYVDVYLGLMPAGNNSAPSGRGMLIETDGLDPTAGDTTRIVLGPLPYGPHIWIRIEAWSPGLYPDTSSAWYNLSGGTGTPPGPPAPTGTISALTITDIGTDYAVLAWTNTNTTEPIRVSYKLDADSIYTFVQVMSSGSVTYTVTGLIPNTAYDFQVEMIDAFTSAVFVSLTASGTTDAGSPSQVLYTPINPRAYAGPADVVGLLVEPVFNTPHEVEFEMTPETAVSSGVPDAWPSDVSPAAGSATQYWPVNSATPGAYGSVDVFSAHNVPNDGRLRYFRARARKIVGGGTIIYSPWTDVYSVMPWSVVVPGTGFGALIDDGSATSSEIDFLDDGTSSDYPVGPPADGGSATSLP